MADFKVGDMVTKMNGKKPFKITSVYGQTVYGIYSHSNNSVTAYKNDLKYYERENNMTTKSTLYELKKDGATVYGSHIGTDSNGNFIMEIKGGGGIIAVKKTELVEVIPYTFSVRIGGKNQSFIGSAGSVEKGEILVYTGSGADQFEIGVVTNVDTKDKSATREFKGCKLETKELSGN